jgi:hypothetical protein
VSIEETTDVSRRKAANISIGILKNVQTLLEKQFLLSSQEISAVIYITIELVSNEAVHAIWPTGVKFDSVLLLHIDVTSYKKNRRRIFIELPRSDTYYVCSAFPSQRP